MDPTHKQGHMLDLVLSLGLPISNLEICDAFFSDHCPLVFDILLSHCHFKSTIPKRCCHVFKPTSHRTILYCFKKLLTPSLGNGTGKMVMNFYDKCKTILDEIARFKTMRQKIQTDPWINEATRSARRRCGSVYLRLKSNTSALLESLFKC